MNATWNSALKLTITVLIIIIIIITNNNGRLDVMAAGTPIQSSDV